MLSDLSVVMEKAWKLSKMTNMPINI